MSAMAMSKRRQEQLIRARESHLIAMREEEKHRVRFHKALATARDEGATVKELQELLGVNRARVYQLFETAYRNRG